MAASQDHDNNALDNTIAAPAAAPSGSVAGGAVWNNEQVECRGQPVKGPGALEDHGASIDDNGDEGPSSQAAAAVSKVDARGVAVDSPQVPPARCPAPDR